MYKYLLESLFAVLLGIDLGVDLSGHMVIFLKLIFGCVGSSLLHVGFL